MALTQIDKNTFIHRPTGYEQKSSSKKVKLRDVRVLSTDDTIKTTISAIPTLTQPKDYYKLINFFKETPELISVILALVTDIVPGKYTITAIDGKSDTLAQKHARQFIEDNMLIQKLRMAIIDKFVYGNGFLVINKVDDSVITKCLDNPNYEVKELGYELKQLREFVDEVSYKNTKIQYLPAHHVSIYAEDDYGEKIKYKQTVSNKHIIFDSDEVIQFKDIPIDGKLFGYSRIYSIKSELQMLWAAKNYVGKFFDNNGTPSLAFVLENTKPGSDEYKSFVKQLEELKNAENKQRNMVFTNKVVVERLNDISKDMQFQGLMQYITSLVSMIYQVPLTRLGMSAGGNAEEATLTHQGYYRNISSQQDEFEEILNTQLFIPLLHCKIRFDREYKEDEIREISVLKTKLDILEQMVRNKFITTDAAGKQALGYLGLSEEYQPSEDEQKENDPQVQYMQGQMKKIDKEDEPAQNDKKNKTPTKYKK